jgi:type IV pilus assembly protein PilO
MALSMPKTQREQGMVFVGVIALLAAAMYWYLVYSPKSAQLAIASAKVDTLEANLVALKARMGRNTTTELKDQAKSYAENMQLMRQLVPSASEVPTLIDQISTAARRAGLELGKIEPIGPEIGADFDAHRFNMTVTGNYHTIAEFVTNVGSLSRIVVPVKLTMGAVPLTAAGDPRKTVVTMVELHTFVAHSAPPSATPEKGGE